MRTAATVSLGPQRSPPPAGPTTTTTVGKKFEAVGSVDEFVPPVLDGSSGRSGPDLKIDKNVLF